MAKNWQQPDRFDEICLDWVDFSEDAIASPEFDAVIENMVFPNVEYRANSGPGKSQFTLPPVLIANDNIFYLDEHGKISAINSTLAHLLGLQKGAVIDEVFRTSLPADSRKGADHHFPDCLTEIVDRHGIRRTVHIFPRRAESDRIIGFIVHVCLLAIPEKTKRHISGRYRITNSEFEIINLVLQRYSPNQISDIRNITINTVRTHINRIIRKLRKFGCHSLLEVISCVLEITEFVENHDREISVQSDALIENPATRIIALPECNATIEYTRFGAPDAMPLVFLHSLEYGYTPPRRFVEEARARNYSIIFPMRPGFGKTTPAHNMARVTEILKSFLITLKIRDAGLVAISTAAPIGLHLWAAEKRVRNLFLINYSLNANDKIEHIEPRWIQGLLRFGIGSQKSFSYALNACQAMIRMIGARRFYKLLYEGIAEDQEYLSDNFQDFERYAEYILTAANESVRLDLTTAFAPLPILNAPLRDRDRVCVINGEKQHNAPGISALAECNRLGLQFRSIKNGARNCIFRHPSEFFTIVESNMVTEKFLEPQSAAAR